MTLNAARNIFRDIMVSVLSIIALLMLSFVIVFINDPKATEGVVFALTGNNDPIMEDELGWNCATMGNSFCGENVEPLFVPTWCYAAVQTNEMGRPGTQYVMQNGANYSACRSN